MRSILTNHAQKRMSQRGVQAETVQTIVQFGDRQIFVGEGCTSISMSRDFAHELAQGGEINPSMADRITNLCVVVANGDESVVTVVRPNSRRRARSYCKSKGYKPSALNRRHH